MPCFDGGYGDSSGLSRNDVEQIIRNEHKEQQRHHNKVHKELFDSLATPLLCEAMDKLEQNGLLYTCSPVLREWFKKHTADDIERIEQAIEEEDFEFINNMDAREKRLYKEIMKKNKH